MLFWRIEPIPKSVVVNTYQNNDIIRKFDFTFLFNHSPTFPVRAKFGGRHWSKNNFAV